MNTHKKRSLDALHGLNEVKELVGEQVHDVRVEVDPNDSPAIQRSITQVFGEMEDSDPRKGYITFDMYLDCLRIIRMAGQAEAGVVLEKEFV